MSLPFGLEIVGGALTPVGDPSSLEKLGVSLPQKRKAPAPPPAEYLQITPLGAGSEVGRSCIILKYKDKTIMLDCGIHPAHTGIAALPYFDEVDPSTIDLLLVSHFHLDHAAALPYFLEKTDFKGRVFMTHPTRSVYRLILQDYVKVSTISVEESLYNENDLKKSMEKIETVNYHQVMHVNGIKFWCYNAGHVLGAAMFFIEIAGVKILYTGDYSRKDDRHLTGAETPELVPDVLLVESTYGTQTLAPLRRREKRFTSLVHQILKRGGRCLIPVFALGRAQELLLILDEYWENNHSLQSYPIWYASALAKKCMTVYQTYINMMNKKIRSQFETSNPFVFKHVRNMRGLEDFDDIGPSVVFASPGMLQNGLSRELFEMWCGDKKNGVIIPGYSVEGTLAKQITLEPKEIESMSGQKLPLRMSVHYVTFSAHADFTETSEFIDKLRPPHIILVHGDANEMGHLSTALKRKYGKDGIKISSPKNCQTVELQFRSEKIAKTVGRLAIRPPTPGDIVSGLVVRKDYSLNLMTPTDLGTFTPLASATIEQTMKIPFKQSFECLQAIVGQIYDTSDVREFVDTGEEKDVKAINIFDSVLITVHSKYEYLTLKWHSNPVNDMIADSLICIILTVESKTSQGIARAMSSGTCSHSPKDSEKNEDLAELLKNHFGDDVHYDKQHNIFIISLDNKTATVHNTTLVVTCKDPVLAKRLEYVCGCIKSAMFPLAHTLDGGKKSVEEELREVFSAPSATEDSSPQTTTEQKTASPTSSQTAPIPNDTPAISSDPTTTPSDTPASPSDTPISPSDPTVSSPEQREETKSDSSSEQQSSQQPSSSSPPSSSISLPQPPQLDSGSDVAGGANTAEKSVSSPTDSSLQDDAIGDDDEPGSPTDDFLFSTTTADDNEQTHVQSTSSTSSDQTSSKGDPPHLGPEFDEEDI